MEPLETNENILCQYDDSNSENDVSDFSLLSQLDPELLDILNTAITGDFQFVPQINNQIVQQIHYEDNQKNCGKRDRKDDDEEQEIKRQKKTILDMAKNYNRPTIENPGQFKCLRRSSCPPWLPKNFCPKCIAYRKAWFEGVKNNGKPKHANASCEWSPYLSIQI